MYVTPGDDGVRMRVLVTGATSSLAHATCDLEIFVVRVSDVWNTVGSAAGVMSGLPVLVLVPDDMTPAIVSESLCRVGVL